MATTVTSSFQSMLNEYLPNKLFSEELMKRDWFLSNIEMDNGWTGGRIVVPFKGAGNTTVEFGQLAGSTDISQSTYVRGEIPSYVEAWGSLILHHRDLMDAEGKIPEATFLKLIPGELDNLMDYFKQVVSTQIGTGPHFATLKTDGTASGKFEVDHIDRFQLGQKLEIKDGNSAATSVYVIAIDVNAATVGTGAITVSLTRGGLAADVSAYTVTQGAKCYHPGVLLNGSFTSIRDVLLPASAGGATHVHGQSKLAYPILQAVAKSGSDMTSSNILEKIFDFYTDVRKKAKGNASTVLMSFKHLGNVMKQLEATKGPFSVTKQPSASIYGWTEIEVTTVKGTLKLVGILEMDDDVMYFLDLKSMTFRTRGGFKKRKAPDGREYFEQRTSTGYSYVIDSCFFGQLEFSAPGHNGILYGISY